MTGRWVPHDTRDEVVDYVRHWNTRAEIAVCTLVLWLGITLSKFHDWRCRYGRVNEHNAWIPRDWWLADWEKQAIIRFCFEYPLEGYWPPAFMMLDRDVVAASPSSVYRVLKAAGRIGRSTNKPSKKGTGFHQPQKPHEHWHIDISYINIHGTFYFLTTILDGYHRYVEHYNRVRLHSAIGYVAPAVKLLGREAEIFAARDRKLTTARERRKEQRDAARPQRVSGLQAVA